MVHKEPSLYLFGDSICYGQLVSAYQTWATALAQALNELIDLPAPVLVQNAGVNGDTTRQALERIHYDVTSHAPEFVLVQFGMNDCNYWATDKGMPRVSPNAFTANLEEIVERLIACGTRHCFVNTNHPSLKGRFAHLDSKSYDESNAEYNVLIRLAYQQMIKRQLPVTLIDVETAWIRYLAETSNDSLKNLLLADGIHLSTSGHRLYGKVILPIIVAEIKAVYL